MKPSLTFTETERMPTLFVGHGSPMNAIEDNEFSRAWVTAAQSLPLPQAILCISAHWETNGTEVTAMARPRTIHDFYGFPAELNAYRYPAPGSPALAELVRSALAGTPVRLDQGWGLDHGTWSVLCRMFPKADVPVVQLSLDRTQPPSVHYALGKKLGSLRRRGVLIVGSGNLVHNLALVRLRDDAYDWAIAFDQEIKQRILDRDHDAIVDYHAFGEMARLAVPTNEHYLPLLYVLASQQDDEEVTFFAEKATLGSISMRSLRIG